MTIHPSTPSSTPLTGGASLSTPVREGLADAFLAGYYAADSNRDNGADHADAAGARPRGVQFSSASMASHVCGNNGKSKSDSSVSGAATRSPFTPRNGQQNPHEVASHRVGGGGGSSITPLHRRSLGVPSSTPIDNYRDSHGAASPPQGTTAGVGGGAVPWMPSSVTRFFGKAGRATRASQLGLSPHHVLHRSFEANQSFPRAAVRASGAPPLDLPDDPHAQFPHLGRNAVAGSQKPAAAAATSSNSHQTASMVAMDGIHGVSFSSPQFHGTFDGATPDCAMPIVSHSLGRSWSFLHFLRPRSRMEAGAAEGRGERGSTAGDSPSIIASPRSRPAVQMAVKNPNKAVLTIDKATTNILIANDMAGDLFGVPTDKLVGTPLSTLLDPSKMRSRGMEAVSESLVDAVNGDTLNLAGKVIDVVHAATGVSMSVSVWIQELKSSTAASDDDDDDSAKSSPTSASSPGAIRCVVILEPVDRLTARLDIDADGVVRGLDDDALQLLGFETREMVLGKKVESFLHSIEYPKRIEASRDNDVASSTPPVFRADVPKRMRKQHATAVSKSGITFPVSLVLDTYGSDENTNDAGEDGAFLSSSPSSYSIFLWVFANISGLLTFDASGIITGYNNFFVLSFLGYDESQLLGLPITAILPQFYGDLIGGEDREDDDEDDVDGDENGVDDSSWPMPPDLKPSVRDVAVDCLVRHQHSRGDTEELLAAADVFVAEAAASKTDSPVATSTAAAAASSALSTPRSYFDKSATTPNSRSLFTSGNDADCEDNNGEEEEEEEVSLFTTKSTLLDNGERPPREIEKGMGEALEMRENRSKAKKESALYSPTMPDRPYSPSDPPYSPIDRDRKDDDEREQDPSLPLDCSNSILNDTNISFDRPSIAPSVSSSFLRRPEAPTPAKWNNNGASSSDSVIAAAGGALPVEKGRDAAEASLGAGGVAQTPKRDVSAMLRLIGESKVAATEVGATEGLPQSSPYTPSQKTPDMKLSGTSPLPLPADINAHSPIAEGEDDAVDDELLSPLSDWNSSVVMYEKNENMSPTTWRSGSISTYVNIPSPYREKIFDEDGDDDGGGGDPPNGVSSVDVSPLDAFRVPQDKRNAKVDESAKVLLSSSFYSEEADSAEPTTRRRPIVSNPLPPPPPLPESFMRHLTQGMSSISLSTSTPAKEPGAITDPSPVRRRLALNGSGGVVQESVGELESSEKAKAVESATTTETPTTTTKTTILDIADGSYCGRAKHRNGTSLGALYQIKRIFVNEGASAERHLQQRPPSAKVVYCMWLSKDPKDWLEISQQQQQLQRRLCSRDASSVLTPGSGCSSRAHSRGGRGPGFGLANFTLNSTAGGISRNDSLQPQTEDKSGNVFLDVADYDDVDSAVVNASSQSCGGGEGAPAAPGGVDESTKTVLLDEDDGDESEDPSPRDDRASEGAASLSKYLTSSEIMNRESRSLESSPGSRRNDDAVAFYPSSSSLPIRTYQREYETLQSIGKGAYGYVKLARRKRDGAVVVVKSIKKSKINAPACWLHDEELERNKGLYKVPLEVALLSRLDHHNIVRMLDCFDGTPEDDDDDVEDANVSGGDLLDDRGRKRGVGETGRGLFGGGGKFFHLIMEKHGKGMDLFEFIDRGPNVDEPLGSYLFRQLVEAVEYLHSRSVVHRDIKDENIIISENFVVKLIDFGSAAYMEPGKTFSTFCGTIEYCSPEVLKGNPYAGPELEVWSLGVTLYTLMFGENPFLSVEESIAAVLHQPATGWGVSRDLLDLLAFILHPDPKARAMIEELVEDPWIYQPIVLADYRWDRVLMNTSFHGNTAADYRTDSNDKRLAAGGGGSDDDDDDKVTVKGDVAGRAKPELLPDKYGRVQVRYDDEDDLFGDDENKENENLFDDDGDEEDNDPRRGKRNDTYDDIQELRDQMQQCLDLETWG